MEMASLTTQLQGPQAPERSLVGSLRRREKYFLIAALAVALVLGSLAGYAAYEEEAEAQFHGGVLDEDRVQADWALVWEFTCAFARWGGGTFLLLGVLPVVARRGWVRGS